MLAQTAVSTHAWRRLVLLAFSAILVVPLVFGASLGTWLRSIAPAEVHVCKCGMAPGHCGCPECARLAPDEGRHRPAGPHPTVGSDCDHGPSSSSPPAAPAVLAAALLGLLAPPRGVNGANPRPAVLFDRDPDAPPTPPPRARA